MEWLTFHKQAIKSILHITYLHKLCLVLYKVWYYCQKYNNMFWVHTKWGQYVSFALVPSMHLQVEWSGVHDVYWSMALKPSCSSAVSLTPPSGTAASKGEKGDRGNQGLKGDLGPAGPKGESSSSGSSSSSSLGGGQKVEILNTLCTSIIRCTQYLYLISVFSLFQGEKGVKVCKQWRKVGCEDWIWGHNKQTVFLSNTQLQISLLMTWNKPTSKYSYK